MRVLCFGACMRACVCVCVVCFKLLLLIFFVMQSVGLVFADGEFDIDLLNQWMSNFLRENGPAIYRMKGILAIKVIFDLGVIARTYTAKYGK